MALIIISFILFLLTSLLIKSLFKNKGISFFFLSLGLINFALLILTVEICGFVGLLSTRWFFLLVQVVEVVAASGFWFYKGKPSLFTSVREIKWTELKSVLKNNLTIIAFLIIVILAYGVLAWLIIKVPPNNADSMHTHLARVMYWLQQGSFEHINSFSVFAQIYPFDAQLPILWTILFTKTDKLVGFIQFFAAIYSAIGIYAICRLMKGSVKHSLLVGLLFLTFPLIIFEATSTQFDLVVASLFVTSIFFFFRYFEKADSSSLFFSALALGLACGTKETIFMMFPGYLFMVIVVILRNKKAWAKIAQWVAITVASFLILGSYPYFNNLVQFGNPFGPAEHVQRDSQGAYSIGEKFQVVPARFVYQFISFDSLPVQLANIGNEVKNNVFQFLDDKLNLDMESLKGVKEAEEPFLFSTGPTWSENQSWFGFASVLLLVPAILIGLVQGIRKKNFITSSLIIFIFGFFVMEIILRPGWDPYQGRYFILSTAAAMPLSIYLISEKVLSKVYLVVTCLVAILTMTVAVLSNEQKPILGRMVVEDQFKQLETSASSGNGIIQQLNQLSRKTLSYLSYNLPFYKPFYKYDEVELRTFSSRFVHEEIVRVVEETVPENARMGVILGGGSFDYVFFGPKLERQLINVNPINLLNDSVWLENQNLSFVLIYNNEKVTSIPTYLELIFSNEKWKLYQVMAKN